MKVYRQLIGWSISLGSVGLASGIGFVIAEYYNNCDLDLIFNFCGNVSIGIFSSAVLLLINAVIGYKIERKKNLLNLYNEILLIYSEWGELEYFSENFKNETALLLINKNNMSKLYHFVCNIAFNIYARAQGIINDIDFLCHNSQITVSFNTIKNDLNRFLGFMLCFRENLHNHKDNMAELKNDIDFYYEHMEDIELILKKYKNMLELIHLYSRDKEKEAEKFRRHAGS